MNIISIITILLIAWMSLKMTSTVQEKAISLSENSNISSTLSSSWEITMNDVEQLKNSLEIAIESEKNDLNRMLLEAQNQ